MIGPLNHIGVAVPDIQAAIDFYRDVMGATDITKPKTLPDMGVRFAFVNLPSGQIELLEPYGDNSPISNFLVRNPKGGQHHICFEVEDIYEAAGQMSDKAVRVLGTPRIGAHGTLVIFLHPSDTGGVLIELMETPKPGASKDHT